MKKYLIGGKEFEMQPLSWRQRQLAAPIQKKLKESMHVTLSGGLSKIKKLQTLLASTESNAGRIQEVLSDIDVNEIDRLLEVSINIDDIILAEDRSFLKFLATILTPTGSKWAPQCIEENVEIMSEIDDATQAEVLQSFLSRQNGLTQGSQNSTNL